MRRWLGLRFAAAPMPPVVVDLAASTEIEVVAAVALAPPPCRDAEGSLAIKSRQHISCASGLVGLLFTLGV